MSVGIRALACYKALTWHYKNKEKKGLGVQLQRKCVALSHVEALVPARMSPVARPNGKNWRKKTHHLDKPLISSDDGI